MSVKRGELIVGHIPRELSKRLAFSVVEARGRVTGDSNGFGVSYRFVGMIMTVLHSPGLKQKLSVINAAFD